MENEFSKVMTERTDKELVQIVTTDRDKHKTLANIKSPLDHIIEHQNAENKHITYLKT